MSLDKQYNFAYDVIKKDWSVRMLDETIKIAEDKNAAQSSSKKLSSISPLEHQLTEQFGHAIKVTIHKNEAGYFRIPFQNGKHMKEILEKFGINEDVVA